MPTPLQPPTPAGAPAAPTPATCCPPSLVELNVGGVLFTTSRATLEECQPHSMLAALVSDRNGPPRRDTQVRQGEGGGGRYGVKEV